MLGTLLFVHHRDKKLPSGRIDLYERYIAAMLGLRDSGLGIEARATKLTDKEKRRVLAHVALHFHVTGVNEVNDETMFQLVAETLVNFRFDEEASRLLPALRERTGLVQGPGAWSFTHKTIGEFLVAELICEGNTHLADNRRLDRNELWDNRHKDAWTAVLFFWAGKTSPRSLEEFVSDLVDQNDETETLLAFSLLDDQGDRLEYKTRRALALRLLQCNLPRNRSTSAVATSSAVPKFMYTEIEVSTAHLRSLSEPQTVVGALAKSLEHGILVSDDMSLARADVRDMMTVAAFWALAPAGTCVTLDLRHRVNHLPFYKVALLSFRATTALIATADALRVAIAEWLTVFPANRRWVPLLLGGLSIEEHEEWRKRSVSDFQEHIWPVLWEWRDEPIHEDWLQGSNECSGWRSGRSFDLLTEIREILGNTGPYSLGISVIQHTDLLGWSDRLLAERAALKAARGAFNKEGGDGAPGPVQEVRGADEDDEGQGGVS